jgi:hypothetical protein
VKGQKYPTPLCWQHTFFFFLGLTLFLFRKVVMLGSFSMAEDPRGGKIERDWRVRALFLHTPLCVRRSQQPDAALQGRETPAEGAGSAAATEADAAGDKAAESADRSSSPRICASDSATLAGECPA